MNRSNNDSRWVSLADLIQQGISPATLATAIEQGDIKTYDQFGRLITADRDGPDEKRTSVPYILKCLSDYYAAQSGMEGPDAHSDRWFDWDSPLLIFGWPNDQIPDFERFEQPPEPENVRKARVRLDSEPGTRQRGTYLIIIAALCKQLEIEPGARGAAAAIEAATEELGVRISDDAIRSILKEIPEAIERRQK